MHTLFRKIRYKLKKFSILGVYMSLVIQKQVYAENKNH